MNSPAVRGAASGTNGVWSSITVRRTSALLVLADPEDVFELAFFERGHGRGTDHAAIGDNAQTADAKTLAHRSTTGIRVVTSAVLPGHSSQHSGLPS
jgi:hypothetical protein